MTTYCAAIHTVYHYFKKSKREENKCWDDVEHVIADHMG